MIHDPSVTTRFLNYLNTHPLDDTNARIILYLLEHQHEVEGITITRASQECFVSPASITRFVQRFDLESFTELKRQLARECAYDSGSSFQLTAEDHGLLTHVPQRYLDTYAERVQESIGATARSLDINEAIALVRLLETAGRIFLFGFDSNVDYLRRFQGSLIHCGTVAFLGATVEAQVDLAERLQDGDLCLVVSSFGQFFRYNRAIVERIGVSPAHTVLLTQSTSIFEATGFDQTIVVTDRPDPRAGSFCMEFYLEFIARLVYARSR